MAWSAWIRAICKVLLTALSGAAPTSPLATTSGWRPPSWTLLGRVAEISSRKQELSYEFCTEIHILRGGSTMALRAARLRILKPTWICLRALRHALAAAWAEEETAFTVSKDATPYLPRSTCVL